MKICKECGMEFLISDEQKQILRKFTLRIKDEYFEIPEPTLCVDCRQKRRLSFRNERVLFKRKCDLTGKDIISIYSPDSPFPVCSSEVWWSDSFNGLDYGMEYDFSRTFFDQFGELMRKVPRLSLQVVNNDNSDYINLSGHCKNCYLLFAADYCQDCYYGSIVINSENCVDTYNCYESKFCYEVVDSWNCYKVMFSANVRNCNESMFLYNCRGCTNCLFSSNLRNKKFYIFNRQHTEQEYIEKREKIMKRIQDGGFLALYEEFRKFIFETPHRALLISRSERSIGNYLSDCKNVHHSFDLTHANDCLYVYNGYQVKDILDVCHTTEFEFGYESMSIGYNSYGIFFANGAWGSSNAYYSNNVQSCENVFGCSQLKRNNYCILNKQYTKEEYFELIPRIIKKMKEDGEFGEFFPVSMSPFDYEDTIANFYYSKQEKVLKYGGPIPEESIVCEVSGRPFQLTHAEVNFYQMMGLPNPTLHPDERHQRRFNLRPKRILIDRACDKCGKITKTTEDLSVSKKMYCEDCYLKEIY